MTPVDVERKKDEHFLCSPRLKGMRSIPENWVFRDPEQEHPRIVAFRGEDPDDDNAFYDEDLHRNYRLGQLTGTFEGGEEFINRWNEY